MFCFFIVIMHTLNEGELLWLLKFKWFQTILQEVVMQQKESSWKDESDVNILRNKTVF